MGAYAGASRPDGEDPGAALAARPAMNVSRLLAPRRLQPDERYAACLVPAFDAGVVRGLGGEPDAGAVARPGLADVLGRGDVTPAGLLPLGVRHRLGRGDFEQLASRLRPFAVPRERRRRADVHRRGRSRAAGRRPPTTPPHTSSWTGRCAPWQGSSARLDEVPGTYARRCGPRSTPPATRSPSGPTATTPVLGPPLYGAWPARQHTVPDDQPRWLRELNLDPRSRAAAGLGAELVRQNQEHFVQWCWEQVQEVLDANRLLSRARLSLEALRRLHARHFAPQPEDRLLQLTAPLHSRTRRGSVTITALDRRRQPARRRRRPRAAPADQPAAPGAPDRDRPGQPGRTAARLAARRPGRPARRDRRRAGRDPDRSSSRTGLMGIPAMASVAVRPERRRRRPHRHRDARGRADRPGHPGPQRHRDRHRRPASAHHPARRPDVRRPRRTAPAGGPRPARAGRLALVQRLRPAQPGHPGAADHRPAHGAAARRRGGPRRGRRR